MSRILTATLTSLAATLAAIGLIATQAAPARAQSGAERIAAVVNDEPISYFDLDHRLRFTIMTAGLADTPEIRQRLIPDVLRGLIDERLKSQEAKRLNIKIEKTEVDGAVRRMESQARMEPGGMKAYLDKAGIAIATLTSRIESDMLWGQVVNQRFRYSTRISDGEINESLARIRANVGKPQNLVAEIFLPVEDAAKERDVVALASRLIEQMRNGVPFRAVAQNFSQSPSAAVGGDLGWIPAGQMEATVDQALAAMQPGQISAPVRGEHGYYILILRERRAAQPMAESEPLLTLSQVLLPLPPNPTPAQVRVQLAQAEALVGNAKSCEDMDRAAKLSGSPMSGSLGAIKLSALPAETRAVVENIPINTPSQALQAKDAMMVFMVCKREIPTAAAEERRRVSDMIMEERLQLGARQYLRDLRRTAFIDLRL